MNIKDNNIIFTYKANLFLFIVQKHIFYDFESIVAKLKLTTYYIAVILQMNIFSVANYFDNIPFIKGCQEREYNREK